MTIVPKRVGTITLSILIVLSLFIGTVALTAALTAGSSPTSRIALSSTSAGAQITPAAKCGQVPVPLASAAPFAVLASSTITSTGATAITGDLGLSPGTSVTGFPPGTITGTKYVTTPPAAWAMANLTIAFNNASARSNCAVTVAGNIGGQTLTPGLYKSTSSLAISSKDLTLSGGGNPNGVFIFQVASALTTTSGRAVILTNGAQAGNVFWEIGSSATLGTTSVMKGTVMAHDSISLLTGSVLDGRAMAQTGEVSLADTTIVVPTTSSATTYPVTFTESGLPAPSWSAIFSGVLATSTTSMIEFDAANGTYSFSIGAVPGYTATPSSGSVMVSGASVGKTITFVTLPAGTYSVLFTESGLGQGLNWSVTLAGVQTTSIGVTIGFTAMNGTPAYSVGAPSGYTAAPSSGTVTVSGATANQAIAFTNSSGNSSGGGGGGSSSGIPTWEWAVIAIIVVGAIAAVVAGLALRKRP